LVLAAFVLPTSAWAAATKVSLVWQSTGRLPSATSVTATPATTQLPTGNGNVVWVCNVGVQDAYIAVGGSSITVSATTGTWLKAGTCGTYDLQPLSASQPIYGYIAAVTATSTTNLEIETGLGTPPTSSGGGGGGGGSVTQGTVPWSDNVTTWANGTLGAMADYGTSPGAVLVPGVNAFITNTPSVAQSGAWTVGGTGNFTVVQPTGTNLHVVCDSGCSGSGGSATFGSTFPTTGTAVGMSQGGNMVAFTGTSDSLNTNVTNTSLTVAQATAASLNATVVGTGTFAVQLSGSTNNINNIGGTISLPTGAATSANQSTEITSLGTIATNTSTLAGAVSASVLQNNVKQWDGTALGAPSNYGTAPGAVAVIGVNAFVTNTPAVSQSGSWTVAGTGSFTVAQATGTNLHMVCDSGCSSSSAPADESAFTAGTTSQTPVGGFYQTTATSNPLTTGQMGAFQVTANRALFTNLRNSSGVEIGTSSTPVQVSLANTAANATALLVTANAGTGTFGMNLSQLDGSALGAPSNYGTSPGAVAVQGVNAYVTNTPAVTQSGTWTSTVTQPTAANLNATVVGTGTFAVQDSTTETNTGTIAGAVTASVLQGNVKQINGITTLAGAGAVGTGSLRVAVGQDTATIAGSAPGTAGSASANVITVQGVTSMTPVQVSQATAANLNATVVGTGTFATQLTGSTNNINNISGTITLPTGAATSANQTTEITSLGTIAGAVSSSVVQSNVKQVAGIALGSPSNYGTAPGAVEVQGVNANVTNTVAISATSLPLPTGAATSALQTTINSTLGSPFQAGGSIGNSTFGATLNTTPSLANGNGVVPTQGGAVLSATNGWYGNLLQGNAVLSATNPVFASITDGTNKAAVKAASTAPVSTDPSLVVGINPNSINANGQATMANSAPAAIASNQSYVDPCASPGIAKSSVQIAISSATTTQLVAISGTTAIYVCHFDFTLNDSVTTANTVQFEYGTSTNCTGTNKLTGTYGTGSVTAGIPVHIAAGYGGTLFTAPASNGLCILSAGSPDIEGVLTYVQQ
jgi:hypothetical protein